MSDNLIISARDVKKTYNTGKVIVPALRGLDLEVRRGEMVAIMGPSGCGKTTLLNTLSGLDSIDSGLVEIDGQDLFKMSDRQRTAYRAANMGFVFQFYNLLPVLSAAENVEMPLLLDRSQRLKPKQARQMALDALEAVGLADQAYQRPAELSGGQRQRVTIARALVNRPAIVWADEPTGDLDSKTSQDIVDLMRKLNRENGQTFVIVTHSEEIGLQCDRIVWMRDGMVETPAGNLAPIPVPTPASANGAAVAVPAI
ncbi:MAG: ABC transporter ATP-binding protein [Ardenticatenaceae bacterium]|nr:ABC transporter ATP-binding protein [Anaerolineales bacterium]MCB8918517.1 ABC transporter ATP-binding protein [Ardenticatenaceae bacterium]